MGTAQERGMLRPLALNGFGRMLPERGTRHARMVHARATNSPILRIEQLPAAIGMCLAAGGRWRWAWSPESGLLTGRDITIDCCSVVLQLPKLLQRQTARAQDATQLMSELAKFNWEQHQAGMVLLSADSASLALWRGNSLVSHKVLTGYTVRRNQGTSQSGHTRRGGRGNTVGAKIRKSEAGRLSSSTAAKLQEWKPEIDQCDVLVHSGSIRCWNEVYSSFAQTPAMGRHDARWVGCGMSIPRPRYVDLLRVFTVLARGSCVIDHNETNEGESKAELIHQLEALCQESHLQQQLDRKVVQRLLRKSSVQRKSNQRERDK